MSARAPEPPRPPAPRRAVRAAISAALLRRAATWRLAAAALVAWCAAAVPLPPLPVLLGCGALALALLPVALRLRSGLRGWALSAVVLAALTGAAVSAHESASLQGRSAYEGPLLVLAEAHTGPSGLYRYAATTPSGPVTVMQRDPPPAAGTRIHVRMSLRGSGPETVGFVQGTPQALRQPSAPWRVRAAAREFLALSAGDAHAGAALLPGLAEGDTSRIPGELEEQMRAVSLSHVTAVSGSNIAIVNLAVVWLLTRFTRARRAAISVGLAVTACYVFVVGPEPSALRAAGMGFVTALGLLRRTGKNAPAILCTAIAALLIAQPQLAVSAGFAMSAAATAALLFLGRPCTRVLARHLPEPVAAALAVPVCAQFGVLPVLVLIGGAPSAWSVPANLVAAPAVAPATIVGMAVLALGAVHSVVPGVDQLGWVLAQLGALAAWWITAVARIASELPGARLAWPAGWAGISLALLMSAAFAIGMVRGGRLLRWTMPIAGVALAVGILVPLATAPPVREWSAAVCDVGQGSAAAVSLGAGRALLADAGPDPSLADACLRRLRVADLWIVLSHFDADHVAGLSGAVRGRSVHFLGISAALAGDPRAGTLARTAGVDATPLAAGAAFAGGDDVSWEVLWPRTRAHPTAGAGSPSGARVEDGNDYSVVLRVTIGDHSLLLPGDVGAEAQAAIAATLRPVDLLIAPHHGSADISPRFFSAARPAMGAVSVGENRYGHPTQAALRAFGTVPVLRTDQCGTIIIATDFAAGGTRACRASGDGAPG